MHCVVSNDRTFAYCHCMGDRYQIVYLSIVRDQFFSLNCLAKFRLRSQLQNSLGLGHSWTRGECGHGFCKFALGQTAEWPVSGRVFDRLARPVARRDDIRRNKRLGLGSPDRISGSVAGVGRRSVPRRRTSDGMRSWYDRVPARGVRQNHL